MLYVNQISNAIPTPETDPKSDVETAIKDVGYEISDREFQIADLQCEIDDRLFDITVLQGEIDELETTREELTETLETLVED